MNMPELITTSIKIKKVPRQAHNVSSLTNLQSRVASAHLLPDTNWCKAAG